MITSQIFKRYFKNKILLFGTLFIIIFFYRFYKDHSIDPNSALIIFLLYFFAISVFGFGDYWFYEKRLLVIKLELLNEAPLKKFMNYGFKLEEADKLVGYINDFQIILSPSGDSDGSRYLIILIPIAIREGLEDYFVKLDNIFNLTFIGQTLFAQAVIKRYNKDYDFDKLYTTIQATTKLLKDQNINPVEVIED